MTQILKGRFDGSKGRDRAHPASLQLLTARHTIDQKGRRVLVGLSAEETREFETLDSLSPSEGGGNRISWTFGGDPTTVTVFALRPFQSVNSTSAAVPSSAAIAWTARSPPAWAILARKATERPIRSREKK